MGLSVTEVHWRIIANLGFKFRSHFIAHCGRREASLVIFTTINRDVTFFILSCFMCSVVVRVNNRPTRERTLINLTHELWFYITFVKHYFLNCFV